MRFSRNMSFTGKVVLVTGASAGIGAATALAFQREGAQVAIVGRNEKKLAAVAAAFPASSPALILRADIDDEKQAATLVKKTVDHFGKLDVLVNNAGITRDASIPDEDYLANYDKIMAINLRAAIYITMTAVPELAKTKGNVINISSITSLKPMSEKFLILYAVSKAGLDHFTRCIALELAHQGIRVNAISPGPVRTDLLQTSGSDVTWDELEKKTALKRVGEVEEIADLILFVASDKAKSITGSNYISDNGMLLI